MSWKPRAGEFIAGLVASAVLWSAYAIGLALFEGADRGDWLGFAGAMLGTMMAISGAVVVERYKVNRERRGSIEEIIRASAEGIALYHKAILRFKKERWKSGVVAEFGAEADQINATIDRLLARPYITDGAISIGTGAMRLMHSIRRAADIFQEANGDNFGDRASDILSESTSVANAVAKRMDAVKTHYGLRVVGLGEHMHPDPPEARRWR